MVARRSLAREWATPRGQRRSLRLEKKTGTASSSQRPTAFKRPIASTITDVATPRTLFKKVLQTQPIVSPLVLEKRNSPERIETVFKFPSQGAPHSSLEISLSDPVPPNTSQTALVKARKKKKVRLSEFERALDEQLTAKAVPSLLSNKSLTKSLQISFTTPAPLQSVGKRGLIRKPNFRGVNVKAFERGIEQNLLQIKGSQSHLVDLQAVTLSNDTEASFADTELFARPQLSGQGGEGFSGLQPASTRKSSSRGSKLSSVQTRQRAAESNVDVDGVAESGQKERWTLEHVDGTEAVPEERAVSPMEEQRENLQVVEEQLVHSNLKETLTSGTEHADGMVDQSLEEAVSPEREQYGKSGVQQFLSPVEEHLISNDIGTPRTSTPVRAKSPLTHPGSLSLLPKKAARRSVKEMVANIIKELDATVAPATVDQRISKASLQEEPHPSEGTTQIPRQTEGRTPNRRRSQKDPELLAGPSAREMAGGTFQPARKISRTDAADEMLSDADVGCEVEEMSEVETDCESDEPTGKTPTFVHARAFQCSPLLPTPRILKVTASKTPSKVFQVKRAPKQVERGCRQKREPALSSSLVKKLFSHYAQMPVTKDAFKAVERCVSLYFKYLSNDLEAYANHAGRKTIESADLELLMRRQGLITDKTPLNVLIERHLPLEYRKLLIPIATSGNKVVPSEPR